RLDIEKNEQKREDVELDAERTVRVLDLVDAALVGLVLGAAPQAPGAQQRGHGEAADPDQQRQGRVRYERIKFGGQSDGSLSAPGRLAPENRDLSGCRGTTKMRAHREN